MLLRRYIASSRARRRSAARGFALIDLLFVIGIIGIIAAIALPRLLTAKNAAGAASAIGTLRSLNSGQLMFALTCGGGFYAPDLTVLGTAPPGTTHGFIAPGLGAARIISKSGYTFEVEGTPFALASPTCNGFGAGVTAQSFKIRADAIEPSNLRFFATNSTMQVYEHNTSLWGSMPESGSPPIGAALH